MRRTKAQQEATAYHEAGHAVIARVLGMTCGDTTIVADQDFAGHSITSVERSIADWECRGRFRWTSMFRARIIMLMAGRESEIECFGKDQGSVFGDGDDLREIELSMPEAETPDESVAKLRVKTRGLVRRHRHAIAQVAAALMKHGTLDALQIDAIVIESGAHLVERVDPLTVSIDEKIARGQAWIGLGKSQHKDGRKYG